MIWLSHNQDGTNWIDSEETEGNRREQELDNDLFREQKRYSQKKGSVKYENYDRQNATSPGTQTSSGLSRKIR